MREIAGRYDAACPEDLNTRGMTVSAKVAVDSLGTSVRQKAGLNREILATGRYKFGAMLVVQGGRGEGTGGLHQPDPPCLRVYGEPQGPQVSLCRMRLLTPR